MSRKKLYKSQPQACGFDWILFTTTILLTAFGVLMVYDASVIEAASQFSDKFYFARLQLIWAGLGLFALSLASKIPLKLVKVFAPILFAITLGFLLAVIIPGVGSLVQGARRWLILGPIRIQPSELVKLTLTIYLASWLEKPRNFWHFVVLIGFLLLLIMAQPDLGTSISVIAIALSMYFISGTPMMQLFSLSLAGFIGSLALIFSSDYRRRRLFTFLNPASDPLGASYHLRQILIALGSGGFFGVGIGRSRQKFAYLPEATTDSIFAIVAEEFGFLGSLIVIALFITLIYRGIIIANNANSPFKKLLAGGITCWIGFQALLNLSAMVSLVPLTGIPLPLISYGGSSLVTVLAGIGLLLNVSRDT